MYAGDQGRITGWHHRRHCDRPCAARQPGRKQQEFTRLFRHRGWETALPLTLALVEEGRHARIAISSISWPRLPAKAFGPNAGTWRSVARRRIMAIVDPNLEWEVDPRDFRFGRRNTPFRRMESQRACHHDTRLRAGSSTNSIAQDGRRRTRRCVMIDRPGTLRDAGVSRLDRRLLGSCGLRQYVRRTGHRGFFPTRAFDGYNRLVLMPAADAGILVVRLPTGE